MLWNTSIAADTSQYSISSHLLCWEDAPNLVFYVKFESKPWQEMHGMNHKGLVDAVRRSSHPYHTSKEAFEILQQQWMSLIAAQYDIPNVHGVPQIWHFVWNLGVILGKNDTVWTNRVLQMLSGAPPVFLMHLMKVMKHFNSNGYLSLEHSILFPSAERVLKSGILHTIWGSTLVELTWYEQ